MKRNILFIAMMVSCTLSASAQLLVDSLGNIGIKAGDSIVKSTLSINHIGDNTYDVYVRSAKTNGMYIKNTNNSYTDTSYGLNVYNTANHRGSTTTYGVYSEVRNAMGNISTGNTFGVYGQASLGQYNYGVFGNLPLNGGNGAAVCGSTYGIPHNISGRYAGYFDGNVFVTGDLYNTNGIYTVTPPPTEMVETTNLSDENISTAAVNGIAASTILDKISNIEAVRYSVLPSVVTTDSMALTMVAPATTSNEAQTVYGLDVESLQAQFPSLVKTCNDSLIGINYTELIPLLLQSIKELQAKVAVLEASKGGNNGGAVAYAPAKPIGTTEMSSTNIAADVVASLSQNTPNPFSEATTIAFTLPESVKDAMLCIYDMNGKQLEQITITERGASSVQIEGYKYSAGMYLYSLIADGAIIDTKRMVLTK